MLLALPTPPMYCIKLCMLSSCLGQCASSSNSKQQPSAAASTLRRSRRRAAGRHPGEALAILAAGYTAANMLQHYHIAEPELKPAL